MEDTDDTTNSRTWFGFYLVYKYQFYFITLNIFIFNKII